MNERFQRHCSIVILNSRLSIKYLDLKQRSKMIFWCIYIRSVTFHAVSSVKKQKDNYYAKYRTNLKMGGYLKYLPPK